MKKYGKKIIIAFIAIIIGGMIIFGNHLDNKQANDFYNHKNYNPDTPFVEDNAKILSKETKEYIADYNQKLKNSSLKSELLVVTVKDLGEHSISEFATQKGKQYKIGNGKNNTGLVYVLSKNDHKNFLATGYGMEDTIPDAKAHELLDSQISHDYFKEDNYDKGIIHDLEKIEPYVIGTSEYNDSSEIYSSSEDDDGETSDSTGIAVFIIFLAVIFLGGAFFTGGSGWFGGSDNSGGDSGGWSGGGGDFGGGGGGSDW
ncbi:TPM domain-containing protein [Lactococcus lactis]|uniref:Beta-propeller domain of methanol dehydrogenase type n=1 Tax=Lactococcus lactis subsp. lactis TaxID=1360 RepID=A0A0V8E8C4_LACLL|nr:TPM domain-containing protein [Lactococcus lactis]KSU22112.1 Beta-propeller domain of methanol dehydrogenase type [Lactococcus lactis subsp. lactis]